MADEQKEDNDKIEGEVCQNGLNVHGIEMDMSSTEDSYRSGRSYHDNFTPAQVDKHLEFLDVNNDRHLLMGSSNLVGRYWSGSIWYYDNLSLAPTVEGSKSGMEFTSGVTEGVFLGENSAVIGMDGGILEFITIDGKGSRLSKEVTFDEYVSAITQVKLCCDSTHILTASTDSCIKVYDTTTTSINLTYNSTHAFYLTSVSPHPSHPELFLSSSLDGTVLLWDTRKIKPAICIFESRDSPTAISWVGNDSNQILIGSSSGTVKLCDDSGNKETIHSLEVFQKPVYRFKPNKFRENSIACCADDTKVAVLGVDQEKIIVKFAEDSHSDYVRGLAWLTESILMSCGWDKLLHRYSVTHGDK